MQWGIVLDVKDSAKVTKEVVVMVVMEGVTEEEEVVDRVTKMAAELIFSVDAHISLMYSGGKPYEYDQCKYSSKTAQNLKTHKLTHSGKTLPEAQRTQKLTPWPGLNLTITWHHLH